MGVAWREGWDGALETLAALTPEALGDLREQVETARAVAASAEGGDVWAYQGVRHAIRLALAHPYWAALEAVGVIRVDLLRAARARYRGAGKTLAGTPEYRALLRTARAVLEALQCE